MRQIPPTAIVAQRLPDDGPFLLVDEETAKKFAAETADDRHQYGGVRSRRVRSRRVRKSVSRKRNITRRSRR